MFVLERNPVTGEVYTIISPATTPVKPVVNGFAHQNGNVTPQINGNHEPVTCNGTPNGNA